MNDFKDMSDRYKQQMMDLYKRHPQVMPKNSVLDNNPMPRENTPIETTPPVTHDIPIEKTTSQDNEVSTPVESSPPLKDAQPSNEVPIEERFPPPEDLPFLNSKEDTPPPKELLPNVELQQPDLNSVGYLKVVTTSAEQTIPVPEVSVIISREVDGNTEILYSLMTNEVGETPVIELPTVSAEMSQNPSSSANGYKPYAIYNISTYMANYFQVKNLNVPIFAGITSIQKVNMIPLPTHNHERKVITYSQTEPNL